MKIIILQAAETLQTLIYTSVGKTGKLINLVFPLCKMIIVPLIFQSPVPLSLVVGVAFAVLSDVLSAPWFLVDVFSFIVHTEIKVGVLAPGEFRWKISLGEDLEPLVVLVCHLHWKLIVIH